MIGGNRPVLAVLLAPEDGSPLIPSPARVDTPEATVCGVPERCVGLWRVGTAKGWRGPSE